MLVLTSESLFGIWGLLDHYRTPALGQICQGSCNGGEVGDKVPIISHDPKKCPDLLLVYWLVPHLDHINLVDLGFDKPPAYDVSQIFGLLQPYCTFLDFPVRPAFLRESTSS